MNPPWTVKLTNVYEFKSIIIVKYVIEINGDSKAIASNITVEISISETLNMRKVLFAFTIYRVNEKLCLWLEQYIHPDVIAKDMYNITEDCMLLWHSLEYTYLYSWFCVQYPVLHNNLTTTVLWIECWIMFFALT